MSGGSYNYLYRKSVEEITASHGGISDLEEMANRLAELGYGSDAARETQALLLDIRAFMNRSETIVNRLEQVWKTVEWLDSGDGGQDDVKAALDAYRNGGAR